MFHHKPHIRTTTTHTTQSTCNGRFMLLGNQNLQGHGLQRQHGEVTLVSYSLNWRSLSCLNFSISAWASSLACFSRRAFPAGQAKLYLGGKKLDCTLSIYITYCLFLLHYFIIVCFVTFHVFASDLDATLHTGNGVLHWRESHLSLTLLTWEWINILAALWKTLKIYILYVCPGNKREHQDYWYLIITHANNMNTYEGCIQ